MSDYDPTIKRHSIRRWPSTEEVVRLDDFDIPPVSMAAWWDFGITPVYIFDSETHGFVQPASTASMSGCEPVYIVEMDDALVG